MPLSNTTMSTLAGGPYFDDFSEDKQFYRVLFRPKKGAQVREMNQLQTILQNQVEQLGAGIYKEGAAVSGGNFTFANNVVALQVIRNDNISIENFYNTDTGLGAIVRGQTSTAEGRVIQVSRQATEDYSALVIAPLTANTFAGGESVSIIDTETDSTLASMVLAPVPLQARSAAIFSVEPGVFFLHGVMVNVDRQSLVLNTATSIVSARIGLVVDETVITEDDDASLLDPAFGYSNYGAPGAHRLKLSATLSSRPIQGTSSVEQNADEKFIEIARIIDGVLIQPVGQLQPDFIEDTLARRTYDESGDYVIRPFRLRVTDHNPPVSVPNVTGTITGNVSSTTIVSGSTATLFTEELSVGDMIVVAGEQREVTSIVNDGVLVVDAVFNTAFTDAPFVVISNTKLNVELDAGKAYVRGYEFETLGTTKLEADRPRTTTTVTNEAVSTAYGPSLFVLRNNTAFFDINSTQQIDLHMVPFTNIVNTAGQYNTTKIGTAYARSMVYDSGVGNANTVYRLYLTGAEFLTKTFQIDGSMNATCLTSNVALNATAKTITLVQHSINSTAAILPSGGNVTAFIGAKVLLYDTLGGQRSFDVLNSNTYYNSTVFTTTLSVDTAAFMDIINVAANVTMVFSDKCIRGMSDSIDTTAGATVSVFSQVGNIPTGNTVFTNAPLTSLLLPFGRRWVKSDSITDMSYETMRQFTAVAAGATLNATHVTYTLNAPAGEIFFPTTLVYTNYVVTNSAGHTVALPATGATAANVAISGSQAQLYLPTSATNSDPITVLAKMQVTTPVVKTKALVLANTNVVSVAISSNNVVSDLAKGHIGINTINSASSNVVSLGVPDVHRIQAVYAAANTANTSTWVNVTSRYTLDNGQRDWCYDHSALVLKSGYAHYGSSPLVVMADYFSHSTGNGFFTAQSYVGSGLTDEYADIPSFTNPKTGSTVELRDVIDFRPVRTANTATANTANNPYVGAAAVFASQQLPFPDDAITVDYDYYLPRIDRVVLTKDRKLKLITGTPSLNPQPAADVQDGITLYLLSYPAYTVSPDVVQSVAFEYRRYTMKDVGKLEKRIENLEYYVQLNVLEQQTLNTPELDQNDMERFKNGILVDPFTSSAVADVLDDDYAASIDGRKKELRPSFVAYAWKLNAYDANNSTNAILVSNTHVTVNYTSTPVVKQPLASAKVNINPFNVATWVGQVRLLPSSDVWFDTTTQPSVNVNLFNENDAWLSDSPYGSVWGDWEEHWAGVKSTDDNDGLVVAGLYTNKSDRPRQYIEVFSSADRTRTGIEISSKASTITKALGPRVVDISVAPYVRAASVAVRADGLKPGSRVMAFLDDQDVTSYVERANEISLASNTVAATFRVGETITSNGSPSGVATVLSITSDVLRVVNASGVFFATSGNVTITGATSGAVAAVSAYKSVSGVVQSVANTTTLTLDAGASSITNSYVGNTIFITSSGTIQRRVITDYVGSTKVATLQTALDGTVAAGATYSIGDLTADDLPTAITAKVAAGDPYFTYFPASVVAQRPGRFYGLFRIPAGVFVAGRHIFRLSDSPTASAATTYAQGSYDALGYTRTIENQYISTRNVDLVPKSVSGREDNLSSIVQATQFVGAGAYIDPMAQTFILDPTQYPSGIVLTSVDLFFAKKDTSNLPVKIQIRPTTNGFPSSDIVLAQAELFSSNVNVISESVTPNPDNTAHRTRFTFPAPVYLFPNQEYALVVTTNSAEYELFVGELGKTIIGDTRVISKQPYGGSFFRPQNARVWTPEPNQDLMFTLNRAVFSTNAAIAYFTLGEYANTDVAYDVVNIQTGHLDFAPTVNASTHTMRLVDSDTTTFEVDFSTTAIERNITLDQRKVVPAANTTAIQFRAAMQTETDAVAPIYDLDRLNIITVRNVIDNGELYANGFVVVNSGTMTTNAAGSYPITISGDGSDAVVYANTNSSGAVVSFYVTAAGSGYTETPTITVSNTAFSVNPTIIYMGETSPKSAITGEQKARYITRRVTLADGFDARDVKVYFDAYRPSGTTIDVYYKVIATGDVETFDQKPWIKMTIDPSVASVYTTDTQAKEYSYTTVHGNAAYTSNGTTYNRFHTFAIKVVMRSVDPVLVPRIQNFRVLALDE